MRMQCITSRVITLSHRFGLCCAQPHSLSVDVFQRFSCRPASIARPLSSKPPGAQAVLLSLGGSRFKHNVGEGVHGAKVGLIWVSGESAGGVQSRVCRSNFWTCRRRRSCFGEGELPILAFSMRWGGGLPAFLAAGFLHGSAPSPTAPCFLPWQPPALVSTPKLFESSGMVGNLEVLGTAGWSSMLAS